MAKKVVIDAGHGGADPGTSANGIVEKDYTLKISQYMANRLNDLGIENALTRDGDITLDSNSRPSKAQSFFGKGNDVILVSNHINAGGGDGAEIIYSLRNNDILSRKIANEFVKVGQNVRKYYQRRLTSDPSKDYYYILRNTPNNESIIVEYGFADSSGDDVNQIKNNYENLAEAVVKALADYIGVQYIAPGNISNNQYVVKRGDTLYSIARNYNVSIDELKRINNMSTNTLNIGQILTIPEGGIIIPEEPILPEESTNIYVVQPGDTLYKIANQFNISVDELKKLNNLDNNMLSIGQELIVSGDEEVEKMNTYTVQIGDTLYSIARKFGVSIDSLKDVNNKNSNLLSIGETLIIPSQSENFRTHVVKRGETLYSIAKLYNTTINALKSLNGLTTNVLSIGEVLKLPN